MVATTLSSVADTKVEHTTSQSMALDCKLSTSTTSISSTKLCCLQAQDWYRWFLGQLGELEQLRVRLPDQQDQEL